MSHGIRLTLHPSCGVLVGIDLMYELDSRPALDSCGYLEAAAAHLISPEFEERCADAVIGLLMVQRDNIGPRTEQSSGGVYDSLAG